MVERCDELGIAVIAHSPLGGPRRAGRARAHAALAEVAAALGATPAEVALAWLLALSPVVVAIPGARRPGDGALGRARRGAPARRATTGRRSSARSAARPSPRAVQPSADGDGEVVLVMGIPGAGKSRVAAEYVARGYLRLNRDERGGSLRDVADALDEQLSAGARRVVLDNTYLTRAARSYVVEAAARHGLPARCVWLDTPLAQAQVNLVERLLERFGSLPTPEELRALGAARAGRARADVADAGACASSSRRRPTRASPASSACRSSRAARAPGARRRVRRGRGAGGARLERARSRRATGARRTWSSTGGPAAHADELDAARRPRSPARSPGPSRARSARTPAARRPAGAGRRCRGCRSRSRGRTASTRRARS